MAYFIVRVELVGGAGERQYEALHALMASFGFQRNGPMDDGTSRKLPTATYFGEAYYPVVGVAEDILRRIQQSVWKTAIVLAVEPTSWSIAE